MNNPFDPEKFRHLKDKAIEVYKKHGLDRAIEFCITGSLPFLAFYTYLMEEFPEHEEMCKVKIKAIKEFYGIW